MSVAVLATSREVVNAALWRQSHTQTARRWTRSIIAATPIRMEQRALVSILLTEMTARPIWFRALEWIVALSASHCRIERVRRIGSCLTLGPLQISGAPWDRDAAVQQALTRLRIDVSAMTDARRLAVLWNGPLEDRVHPVAYSDVIQLAFWRSIHLIRVVDSNLEGGGKTTLGDGIHPHGTVSAYGRAKLGLRSNVVAHFLWMVAHRAERQDRL